MKKGLLFFFILLSANVFCQNEFAANSFYSAVKKLQEDAQKGFMGYKGVKLKSQFEEINDEYKSTLLLPLADSGKIVIPVSGNPYAVYFFEPEKRKEKIDERAVGLREALITAYGKTLYAKTISTTVKNHIHSDTYLYDNADETHVSNALFRLSIFFMENKYYLTLEIRGKNP